MTANPNGAWVAQRARNLPLVLGERGRRVRFLLRDHDARFCRSFDDVFRPADAEVLLTPVQAPKGERLRRTLGWHGPCREPADRWARAVGGGAPGLRPALQTGIVRTGRWGWNRLTHPPP